MTEQKSGNEGDYTNHCLLCGASDKLRMFPHRNQGGKMIGWIFVCEAHEDHEIPETLTWYRGEEK